MWLYASFASFSLALTDVVIGSVGLGDILNDVQEMLVMIVTTVFFVIHILIKEAQVSKNPD